MCLDAQPCPTLCDPIDCSPPGSSVHGDSLGKNTGMGCQALLQGIFPTQGSNPGLPHCRRILYHLSHQESPRILEWVTILFTRGSSRPRNQTRISFIADGFFTHWATLMVTCCLPWGPDHPFGVFNKRLKNKMLWTWTVSRASKCNTGSWCLDV